MIAEKASQLLHLQISEIQVPSQHISAQGGAGHQAVHIRPICVFHTVLQAVQPCNCRCWAQRHAKEFLKACCFAVNVSMYTKQPGCCRMIHRHTCLSACHLSRPPGPSETNDRQTRLHAIQMHLHDIICGCSVGFALKTGPQDYSMLASREPYSNIHYYGMSRSRGW